MPDPSHNLSRAPGAASPAGQPDAAESTTPDAPHRFARLPTPELDIYGNQLARCLKALGTNAPIRVDIQRELITVRAEQHARASASKPARTPDISQLTPDALDRTRRELQTSLSLARPGSPARRLILTHLNVIDTELARLTALGQPEQ